MRIGGQSLHAVITSTFDTIDRDFMERNDSTSSERLESFIGRPSEQRTSRLDDVKAAIAQDDERSRLLPDALVLYERYCDEARAQSKRWGV